MASGFRAIAGPLRAAWSAPSGGLLHAAQRLPRDWPVVLGGLILLLTGLAAVLAPFITRGDPTFIRIDHRLAPPFSPEYVLGADELGRDILTRLIWGARVSLLVAILPVGVALMAGLAVGMLSGYTRGALDSVVMRVLDVFFAFPKVLLALGLAAVLGPSLRTILITISVVGIPVFARLARGLVLTVREGEYIEAARSLGAGPAWILTRHVLVNILGPVVVYATLETGRNVVLASSLSFLGLGVQSPNADWGLMLSEGRSMMAAAPHIATIPGLAIFLVTLSFNLVGDGLRDMLDPRMET